MQESILRRLALFCCLVSQPIQANPQLTLEQTRAETLANNVDLKLARLRIAESEGRLHQAFSSLHPRLEVDASLANRTVNLAAQGLTALGGGTNPSLRIGPFYSFETRLKLVLTVFNASAGWSIRRAQAEQEVLRLESDLTRTELVRLANNCYLQLRSAEAEVEVNLANCVAAEATLQLSSDQHRAGLASKLEVVRSQNSLAHQRFQLAQSREQLQLAKLELTRLTGRSQAESLASDTHSRLVLDFRPADVSSAVALALRQRVECLVALERQSQAEAALGEARATSSPNLNFHGEYGLSGNTPAHNVLGTHSLGLSLNFPLFDGGLSEGKILEAQSRLQQQQILAQDLVAKIEQEVRQAYASLALSEQKAQLVQESESLAESELKLARNRYRVGAGTHLELIEADASLVATKAQNLQSQVAVWRALAQVAAALGTPEKLRELESL